MAIYIIGRDSSQLQKVAEFAITKQDIELLVQKEYDLTKRKITSMKINLSLQVVEVELEDISTSKKKSSKQKYSSTIELIKLNQVK